MSVQLTHGLPVAHWRNGSVASCREAGAGSTPAWAACTGEVKRSDATFITSSEWVQLPPPAPRGMMRMASGSPAKGILCQFESDHTLQTLSTPRTFRHTRVAASEGVMKRGDCSLSLLARTTPLQGEGDGSKPSESTCGRF